MSDGPFNQFKSHRRELLGCLQTADDNLRATLHRHGLEAPARAHLDRALAHIREAYIAVNEQTRIRSVHELAEQLARIEQVQATLHAQQNPANKPSTSIRI